MYCSYFLFIRAAGKMKLKLGRTLFIVLSVYLILIIIFKIVTLLSAKISIMYLH